MQQDASVCPSCGATIQAVQPPTAAQPCPYCGWVPVEAKAQPGPKLFRQLIAETKSDPESLLDQVPEEVRALLADRLRAPAPATDLRTDTEQALRGLGYAVEQDSHGARIVPGARVSGSPSVLSSTEVVKLAAELEGGVKPRGQLPVCPKCQGLSPIGASKCQWCAEPLAPPPPG